MQPFGVLGPDGSLMYPPCIRFDLTTTRRAARRNAKDAVGANGELFVSDDQNGNVYRIVYVGQ